jgi:hypothetical protein
LLGRISERNIPAEYRPYIVNISNILGIPWNKKGACGDTYWKKTIGKIDETIEKWEDRRLSFVGKVLVIKTVLLSKLWYGARVVILTKKKLYKKLNNACSGFYGRERQN